ncbi:serine/arginine-rich splicing factor 4-like [Agrilus planipennis]|uniref:Serine/arginine-rich splicing factor 4-like n=1 Tax=Agrilus planipennis TaxID=224129 RepID=A0A1W4WNR9_AGRPL|nr:serine/arginine-rich splicing factor 4-like [Agrilus planipennis]
MDSRNGKTTREERRESERVVSDPPSRPSLTKREETPYSQCRTSLHDSNSSIEQRKQTLWRRHSGLSLKRCSKHSLKKKYSGLQDEGNTPASNDNSKKSADSKQSSKEVTPGILSRNPFINFLREYRRKNKEKLAKLSQIEIVRTCAQEWRKLTPKEKSVYVEQAARAPRSRRRRSRRRRSRSRSRSHSPNFSPQSLRRGRSRSRSRRRRKGSKRRRSGKRRKGRRSRRRFTF